jgi:hypothetical protein
MYRRILLARNFPKFAAIIGLGVLYCLISSCAPDQRPPPTATVMPPASPTAALPCEQELIPPQIMEIQPAEPAAGSEVKVIGSGGYIQDTCGGYIEGAREFKLYLDHEPIGALSCYVNHCEGNLTLPGTLVVGSHCLAVEANTCEFEFQVVTK